MNTSDYASPNPFCTDYHLGPENYVEQWASAFGEDEFGYWMEFSFKGVTQRLRWIHPGHFLMGSPPDEPERIKERESQHLIRLTKGYWLADTPCTQGLWQAVMGENSSKFKDEEDSLQKPVESVSWNDCQQFIARLNEGTPGLGVHLPNEAQWEYACRAGTSTPFSFGDNISTEQVNYNGNYPYGNAKKGEFRAKTAPVKSLPPNGWGLYEMHGNVWEWCSDWFWDHYEKDKQVDPTGPKKGADRVLRGGSWISGGRYVRSASRDRYSPDNRDYFTGLRLARG